MSETPQHCLFVPGLMSQNVLKAHPCCTSCQNFLPFLGLDNIPPQVWKTRFLPLGPPGHAAALQARKCPSSPCFSPLGGSGGAGSRDYMVTAASSRPGVVLLLLFLGLCVDAVPWGWSLPTEVALCPAAPLLTFLAQCLFTLEVARPGDRLRDSSGACKPVTQPSRRLWHLARLTQPWDRGEETARHARGQSRAGRQPPGPCVPQVLHARVAWGLAARSPGSPVPTLASPTTWPGLCLPSCGC